MKQKLGDLEGEFYRFTRQSYIIIRRSGGDHDCFCKTIVSFTTITRPDYYQVNKQNTLQYLTLTAIVLDDLIVIYNNV